MQVTMLLAEAAQAAEGKLNILGGGWSVIGTEPTPTAIAIYIQVPWDRANVQHDFLLEMLDSDGQPIEIEGQDEDEKHPIKIEGQFEVGRPAGLKPGTPIDFPLAINLAPMALKPASRYEWRLTINGESNEGWRLAFSTR